MITIHTKVNSDLLHTIPTTLLLSFNRELNLEELFFFDIETTGFSPATSYVYLIGCMYYEKDSFYITQWLLEDIQKENELLELFREKIVNYKSIVHFNGSGFDVPFILKKCKHYGIRNPFSHMEHLDLYKELLPFKRLLPTHNLKLQQVQQLAGYKRKDTCTGADLIEIYTNFIGRNRYEKLAKATSKNVVSTPPHIASRQTAEELAGILLLHNYEDVEGLLPACSLLLYSKVFEDIPISSTSSSLSILPDDYIAVESTLPFTLPFPITYQMPLHSYSGKGEDTKLHPYYYCNIHLSINTNTIKLILPMLCEELKYYYPNYKDYYYLPLEDTAIHKSVAEYVDKEYRIKAKPSTCYTKKKGYFIPYLLSKKEDTYPLPTPMFYMDYGDKIGFYEIDINSVFDTSIYYDYIREMIRKILRNKEVGVDG